MIATVLYTEVVKSSSYSNTSFNFYFNIFPPVLLPAL